MTQNDNAIRDIQRAVQDIEAIVLDFNIDYGPDLPTMIKSVILILEKVIIQLNEIIEVTTHD